MKSFKPIIFILVLFIFSIFTINIRMLPNVEASSMLNFDIASYPRNKTSQLNPLKEKLKIDDDVFVDNLSISSYKTYQSTGDIAFAGNFKVGDTVFELTLFNIGKLELNTWISQNFPQVKYNEDNFSENYSKKTDINLKSDLKRVVAKVDNRYFVYYLKQVSDKVLSLGFQLGNYKSKDIDNILSSIKIKQSNFDSDNMGIKNDLSNNTSNINDFNKNLKNNLNLKLLSVTFTKVLADASIYYLPWANGETHNVTQDWGANDNPPCTDCSHIGLSGYAYDFGMVENTNVLASAAGTVTYVKSGETVCGNSSYVNNANYIVISHADGKATEYHHLKNVYVNVGDTVVQGQLIGTSGHTGYTVPAGGIDCQDHLHFQKQAQGGSYTKSEPFFFVEYPNVSVDGELTYPNSYTSQNVMQNGSGTCTGELALVNTSKSNFSCVTSSQILLITGATINPESDLHIQ